MTFAACSWTRPSSVCAASTLGSDVSSAEVDWRNMRVKGVGMDKEERRLAERGSCSVEDFWLMLQGFFEAPYAR